jgi:hypothetical protein
MSPRTTRCLLGLSLLATMIAAWFAPSAETAGVALSERVQTAATSAGAATRAASNQDANTSARAATLAPEEVLTIRPRELDDEDDEQDARLFAATKWSPAATTAPVAASAPAAAAPAPTQAPPLPFHVLGRYEEAGKEIVFLQYNDQNLVVHVGDTIAEQYKVEGLHGTTLTLRYLPLNQEQTLEVGGTSENK